MFRKNIRAIYRNLIRIRNVKNIKNADNRPTCQGSLIVFGHKDKDAVTTPQLGSVSRKRTLIISSLFSIPHVKAEEILQQTVTSTQPTTENVETISNSESVKQNVETAHSVDIIPEPPPIPIEDAPLAEVVNLSGEPAFSSLGLGGWSPVGLIQNCFEYLHVTVGIPWWGTIVIGTIAVRILLFPLVIAAQRNGAKMNNYLPQLQVLQVKMTEARQTGNQLEAARYSQEMMLFMKEKGLNPLKNILVPLAQMPVFISFFMSLRQMANVPVESMREGGLFWFVDLTVPDQFFILPIITSITMWATIEVGTDTARLSAQNMQMLKYVLRAMPVVILPFTVNFPGAILCYWVSTNFISLAQVGFLRIPAVRDFFKIERLINHDPTALPIKRKKFVEGMKESWTNMKITRELEERQRFDDLQFQRAGRGPVVKTYKYNPLEIKDSDKKSN